MAGPDARAANDRARWLALGLALLMGAYALGTLALALDARVARFFLARFHLRSESFALWALSAPSPWMYGFENRVLVSATPQTTSSLLAPTAPDRWVTLNHQPARVFTFAPLRFLFAQPGMKYVYLRSRYRDVALETGYEVHSRGLTSPMLVRRADPSP